jgi:hypothetical protein
MGKGATGAQNSIAGSQQSFMNTLQSDFGTAFAGQQNILNGLSKSLTTTLNAGPSQFGFSAPETSALNTLATSSNSQAYQNAKAATGEAAAASGGGANLPTGAQGETNAQLAQESAQNQSNALLGIQEAGYKQGAANYNEAVSGLNSAASIENPNGLAGSANNAGENAFGSATTIQKTNQAASPWSQVGGLVGSLAGTALNAYLPGAGSLTSGLGGNTDTNSQSQLQTTFGNQAPQLPNFNSGGGGYGFDPNAGNGLGSSLLPSF